LAKRSKKLPDKGVKKKLHGGEVVCRRGVLRAVGSRAAKEDFKGGPGGWDPRLDANVEKKLGKSDGRGVKNNCVLKKRSESRDSYVPAPWGRMMTVGEGGSARINGTETQGQRTGAGALRKVGGEELETFLLHLRKCGGAGDATGVNHL